MAFILPYDPVPLEKILPIFRKLALYPTVVYIDLFHKPRQEKNPIHISTQPS
jgi:hypothetical protein